MEKQRVGNKILGLILLGSMWALVLGTTGSVSAAGTTYRVVPGGLITGKVQSV